MTTLQTAISGEPVSGFKRVAKHENFVVTKDLNMVQQVRVILTDEDGVPMLAKIAADETLNESQKKSLSERYQDQIVTRTTEGAFVNMEGNVVEATAEDAMPQLDYFQHITLGNMKQIGLEITDETPFSSLLYAMIKNEMVNIDARNGL